MFHMSKTIWFVSVILDARHTPLFDIIRISVVLPREWILNRFHADWAYIGISDTWHLAGAGSFFSQHSK